MATRTLTAMFKTRSEAERAEQALTSELGLNRSMIQTSPETNATDAGYDPARPYEEKGFFASLKNLMLPEEDRYAYAEGMRRGAVLLNAKVDEGQIDRASDILEHAGAVDLDAQETEWRKSGWAGYDASAHSSMRGATAGTAPTGRQDETIKVVEEKLVVGKRAVEGGRVRVRSYVVETPVEENVTLHQERVTVERHPVDRAATAADLAAFQERTIEARATSEEAVVSKEARIVEEIGVRKEAADRVETVRDTVRKTEVEVEDNAANRVGTMPGAAATTTTGTGTMGGTTTGGTGTGAAASVDRTLNTNVSGTNPGANAPDGTGNNPPGTMASRAVDKTLGTNISGANPERK